MKILKYFIIMILTCSSITAIVLYKKYSLHIQFNENLLESKVGRINKNEGILYKKKRKIDPSFTKNVEYITSNTNIDIVIPVVDRDLEVLEYGLKAARAMVAHKITNIYLVSPPSQKIENFARDNNCKYIIEDKVLPNSKIKNYGGWYIQQFIKLNAGTITTEDHYLVFDADTIYLRPQIFKQKDTYLVNCHWDGSALRKTATQNILKNNNVYLYDFVAHQMFFSKKVLEKMKNHIYLIHGRTWDQVILDSFSTNDGKNGFSEYDLYMTYLTEFSEEKFKFISDANISLYRNKLEYLPQIASVYSSDYKSISLHHFSFF